MRILYFFFLTFIPFIALNVYSQTGKKYPKKMSDHDRAEVLLTSLDQLIEDNTEMLGKFIKTTDSLYQIMSKMASKGVDTSYIRKRYYSEKLFNLEQQLNTLHQLTSIIQGVSPDQLTGNSQLAGSFQVVRHSQEATQTGNAPGSKDNEPGESDSKEKVTRFFTDSRDGRTYRFIEIGDKLWMAENLKYETANGDWCYYDNTSHCDKYGRLYDWHTAKNACPRGWKLPSKSDFEAMFNELGGDGEVAFNALIEGGETGFNALLGGWGEDNGTYEGLGTFGVWWSSSEQSNINAWSMDMGIGIRDAGMDNNKKSTVLSVRCMSNLYLSQSK